MSRTPIVTVFVIAAALLGETQISNAQSAYSYPWCAISGGKDAGSMTCYYTSWQQCMTTQGIGGNCIESPYYHAQPTQLPHGSLVKPRHRRHARTVEVREEGEGARLAPPLDQRIVSSDHLSGSVIMAITAR